METLKKGYFAFLLLSLALALPACGGGGGGGGEGGGGGGQQPPASLLNGTFSGDITTTREELSSFETMHISLTTASPLNGTFSIGGDVGTLSGNAEGDSATFTGTIEGICPGSFDGSITMMADNTLSINMSGLDCYGQFSSAGILNKVACINIAGKWRVSENGSITCLFDGESETETISGSATVVIEQNGCNVSYVPPTINAPREGQIDGNKITLSGTFVVPLVSGVIFSQNIITFKAPIADEEKFDLFGSGMATGTAEGIGFTCSGTSTAKFKRCYDVAVAVLQGFSIGLFVPRAELDNIRDQAIQVNPELVTAKTFLSGPGQLSWVQNWLNEINTDCDSQAKVILVGHSLGGNAVRLSNFTNMCSRIAIDPINPDEIAKIPPNFYQRDLTFDPISTMGRLINVLASTNADLEGGMGFGLLGYHITGAEELVEPGTNHSTIVRRVLESNLVASEVQGCLK